MLNSRFDQPQVGRLSLNQTQFDLSAWGKGDGSGLEVIKNIRIGPAFEKLATNFDGDDLLICQGPGKTTPT